MRILFFGAKGWIGPQFINYLESRGHTILKATSRTDDDAACEREIQETQPTHIVNFTGRTHGIAEDGTAYTTIDYLELPGKLQENMRDNLYGPLNLAILCKKHGVHYSYLGTGCIFSYDEDHPFEQEVHGFLESEKPNFFGSSYSVVKGFTDQILAKAEMNTLNLRIRMPINAEKNVRNFITKITNYEYVCSIKNSMTVLPDMWPVIEDLMLKHQTGTVNLTNPGLISHNEILEMYKELVDPAFTWKNFSVEDQSKVLKASRSNNFLDTTFLETHYPSVKRIKESVFEILKQYGKNE